jgi:hypothetical protein
MSTPAENNEETESQTESQTDQRAVDPATGLLIIEKLPQDWKHYKFGPGGEFTTATKVRLVIEHKMSREGAERAKTLHWRTAEVFQEQTAKFLNEDGTATDEFVKNHPEDKMLAFWQERAKKWAAKQARKRGMVEVRLWRLPNEPTPKEINENLQKEAKTPVEVMAVDPWWGENWRPKGGYSLWMTEKDAECLLQDTGGNILWNRDTEVKLTPGRGLEHLKTNLEGSKWDE